MACETIGASIGAIVSSEPTAGVEEQVMEFPALQGGVSLLEGGTVPVQLEEHVGVEQQGHHLDDRLGRQARDRLAPSLHRPRLSQGVDQRRRSPVVQDDPGMVQRRLQDHLPPRAAGIGEPGELVVTVWQDRAEGTRGQGRERHERG